MTAAYRIETKSPEVTQEVGHVLGVEARAGDIFLLTGPLGAGKTCLTQGIARGLGVEGYVRSPTFVLMARYSGRLTLHHVDLYRIGEPIEAWDLGLEEQLFSDGICVIEWADKATELFPENALWIDLDYALGESHRTITHRTITFRAAHERYQPVLQKLCQTFPALEEVKP